MGLAHSLTFVHWKQTNDNNWKANVTWIFFKFKSCIKDIMCSYHKILIKKFNSNIVMCNSNSQQTLVLFDSWRLTVHVLMATTEIKSKNRNSVWIHNLHNIAAILVWIAWPFSYGMTYRKEQLFYKLPDYFLDSL